MATLTRYKSFKSLKKKAAGKAIKSVASKKVAQTEVEAFFQLLSQTKAKAKKA